MAAAPAAARPGVPWFGTYEVAVAGGSQDTNWTLDHQSDPNLYCDATETGKGTEDEQFLPGAAKVVQLTGVGTHATVGLIDGLTLPVVYNREGSIATGQPPSNQQDCPSGGDDGSNPTPDCGTRTFTYTIDVDPGPSSPSIAEDAASNNPDNDLYQDCPVEGDSAPAFASPLSSWCRRWGRSTPGACLRATSI